MRYYKSNSFVASLSNSSTNNVGVLKNIQTYVALSNNITQIPIVATGIDLTTCSMDVFYQGVLLKSSDYSIDAVNKKIVLSWGINTGEEIDYRIYI